MTNPSALSPGRRHRPAALLFGSNILIPQHVSHRRRTGILVRAALVVCCVAIALLLDGPVARRTGTLPAGLQATARLFTDLGTSGYMLVIAAGFGAYCSFRLKGHAPLSQAAQHWRLRCERAIVFFIVIAVTGIGAQLLKHLVGRSRPRLMDSVGAFHLDPFSIKASLASFPSGHATTAFAAATVLGLLTPKWRPALFGLATLIALSRVVVGAHYVSDIVAGGTIGVLATVVIVRWLAERRVAFTVADGALVPRSVMTGQTRTDAAR